MSKDNGETHYCTTMCHGVHCACGKIGVPGKIKFTSHTERVSCEECKRMLRSY